MTEIGVKADSDPNDTELMFHRIDLRVGAMDSVGVGALGDRPLPESM